MLPKLCRGGSQQPGGGELCFSFRRLLKWLLHVVAESPCERPTWELALCRCSQMSPGDAVFQAGRFAGWGVGL